MKIEKVSENQIRCTLTREDLDDRQLKISEIAYGSEKAKELFRDMMQQANYEYGFEAEDIPLMIEAIPMSSGCIVFIITKVEDPEELDNRFSRFAPSHHEDQDEYGFHEEDDPEEYDPEEYNSKEYDSNDAASMEHDSEDGDTVINDIMEFNGSINESEEALNENHSNNLISSNSGSSSNPISDVLDEVFDLFRKMKDSAKKPVKGHDNTVENDVINNDTGKDNALNDNMNDSMRSELSGSDKANQNKSKYPNTNAGQNGSAGTGSRNVSQNVSAGTGSRNVSQNVSAGTGSRNAGKGSDKNQPAFRIFSFDHLDTLIDATHLISKCYEGDSILYKNPENDRYYLLLNRGDYSLTEFSKICYLLIEYSTLEKTANSYLAYMEEHFSVVIAKNAVQALAQI